MRLLFTHHTFVRMADYHPEFAPFVWRDLKPLSEPGADGVFLMLRTFMDALGRGRPSTLTSYLNNERAQKYNHVQHVYVFDRSQADFYQMVLDGRGLVVVTVTWLEKSERIRVLDDPTPPAKMADVTEITVPYYLNAESAQPRFGSIDTPWAKKVPVICGVPAKMGPSQGVDSSGRQKRTDFIQKKDKG